MNRLRIQQRKDESPDLFAMRAFALAMKHMDDNQMYAASSWIASAARDTLFKRRDEAYLARKANK